MRKTYCDNHPDREAVISIAIRVLPTVGFRPMLVGYSVSSSFVDLCPECLSVILPKERR